MAPLDAKGVPSVVSTYFMSRGGREIKCAATHLLSTRPTSRCDGGSSGGRYQ